jgi:hypothetical protein
MGLSRLDTGFLTTHVIGKWGQYAGVKCIKYNKKYYILEGDRADGYRILNVSDKILLKALEEKDEIDVINFIEKMAATTFYHQEGHGYITYDSDLFPPLLDKKLYEEICKQYPGFSMMSLC